MDPETGVRDAVVPFKVLSKFRAFVPDFEKSGPGKPCFGRNAVPDGRGVVRVGDAVRVLRVLP